MRAIDRLQDIPMQVSASASMLRRFLGLALLALTYTADTTDQPSGDKLRRRVSELYGDTADLEHKLDTAFFDQIYVQRPEQHELWRLIPGRELILLHGHVGTGKTTILLKLRHEHAIKGVNTFIYVNAKELYERSPSRPVPIDEWTGEYISGLLFDRFVAGSVDDWNFYKVMNDPALARTKMTIIGHSHTKVESLQEWSALMSSYPRLQELAASAPSDMTTLIRYVVEKKQLLPVICIDNSDRFPLPQQYALLSLALKMTEGGKIPVIFSIRETNIRRLISEAMVTGGRSDFLSDLHLVEYLERLDAGQADRVQMEHLNQASVEGLLRTRVEFVRNHIGEHLQDYRELLDFVRSARGLEPAAIEDERVYGEFMDLFWHTLRTIAGAFSEMKVVIQDIHNDNCRELMKFFYQFISTIALNPEAQYGLEALVKQSAGRPFVEYTGLRTFLYKWLICNGEIVLKVDSAIPNIFEFEAPLKQLNLRLLEYLYNWDRVSPNRPLTFQALLNDFSQFGLARSDLLEAIERLGKRGGFYELGYLWVNRRSAAITRDTTLEILDAGRHFVRTLSTSREYVFWNAMLLDLEPPLCANWIPFSKVYDDEFKLELVYRFIQDTLLPSASSEIEFVNTKLRLKDWKGRASTYFMNLFGVNGHLYLNRLVTSVIGTIDSSDLTEDLKRVQRQRYSALQNRARLLEQSPAT